MLLPFTPFTLPLPILFLPSPSGLSSPLSRGVTNQAGRTPGKSSLASLAPVSFNLISPVSALLVFPAISTTSEPAVVQRTSTISSPAAPKITHNTTEVTAVRLTSPALKSHSQSSAGQTPIIPSSPLSREFRAHVNVLPMVVEVKMHTNHYYIIYI